MNGRKLIAYQLDNAILENADSVYCSKFLGYWSDLGDWESVLNEKNLIDRKITSENTTEIECKNTNLLSFDNKRIVGVGLDNITAVSVSDAILISNSSKKENIKEIVPLLNQKNKRRKLFY